VSKLPLPGWARHPMLKTRHVEPVGVSNAVDSVCLTPELPCLKNSNRHKPGYKRNYMREFMRKKRAILKSNAAN